MCIIQSKKLSPKMNDGFFYYTKSSFVYVEKLALPDRTNVGILLYLLRLVAQFDPLPANAS